MLGLLNRQLNLFFMPLAEQVISFQHPILDPIDSVLDDDELLGLVTDLLASRYPKSTKTGRPGMAPDRLLRSCVLKHTMDWSFRTLEAELKMNLVYRRFTHFDEDRIPNISTFSRNFALLGEEGTKKIHERVAELAQKEGVTRGNRLRTDTTVIETNIHYPSDSSLLGDGIRVLTRALTRIRSEVEAGAVSITDHARATTRRIIEISRAARGTSQAARDRMLESYRKLIALASGVVRETEDTLEKLAANSILITGSLLTVTAQEEELRHFLPLVQKVISQTEERLFEGNRHVKGKIISIFEPHSVPIRKGKPHKPTEFGRLFRIDEVEGGIISGYEVLDGNPADTNAWKTALDGHVEMFDRPPYMATADRGYFSAENERYAEDIGVKRVALPGRGRLSQSRAATQKERWFRRASRWRNGVEARIAILKNVFGLHCACYKGDTGVKRHAGWAVIANNLSAIARYKNKRSKDCDD